MRDSILEVLGEAAGPMTATEIREELNRRGVPASCDNVLHSLTAARRGGLVARSGRRGGGGHHRPGYRWRLIAEVERLQAEQQARLLSAAYLDEADERRWAGMLAGVEDDVLLLEDLLELRERLEGLAQRAGVDLVEAVRQALALDEDQVAAWKGAIHAAAEAAERRWPNVLDHGLEPGEISHDLEVPRG